MIYRWLMFTKGHSIYPWWTQMSHRLNTINIRVHQGLAAITILTSRQAPALANTPASASQQAAQLRPRAAPPAECHDGKSISKVKPSNKKGAHQFEVRSPWKGLFLWIRTNAWWVLSMNGAVFMDKNEKGDFLGWYYCTLICSGFQPAKHNCC